MISKKLISHFDMNVCCNLQLLFSNFSRKISVGKNLLYGKLPKYLPQYLLKYLLTRMWFIIFSCDSFRYFQQV